MDFMPRFSYDDIFLHKAILLLNEGTISIREPITDGIIDLT